MLHINLICIGKLKETYLKEAIQEYSKRLSKYYSFQIIELPDEKLPDTLNSSIISQIQDIESEKIISHIPKNSYVISLDLTGKQYTSEEFAEKIENIKISNSNLTFIIGGSLGLNTKLKNLSNEKICFSKMTFPHQLIRVFLIEQIFRAAKISNNEKYHH